MADEQGEYETPSEGLTSESSEEEGVEISELSTDAQPNSSSLESPNIAKTKNNNTVNKSKAHDRSPENKSHESDPVTEPDQKKRAIEENTGTANIEKAANHDHSSSAGFDTDDNIPLSQYGSATTGNDREAAPAVGRRKTKPDILRKALHNRAMRRMAGQLHETETEKCVKDCLNILVDSASWSVVMVSSFREHQPLFLM